jgi:hypothetical protein
MSGGGALWDDPQQAQKVLKQLSDHRSWVSTFRKVEKGLEDLAALVEMAGDGVFS